MALNSIPDEGKWLRQELGWIKTDSPMNKSNESTGPNRDR